MPQRVPAPARPDWDTRTYGVLVRFADDLLVMCKSRQQAQAALTRLRELLADLGLSPKEAKTRIVNWRWAEKGRLSRLSPPRCARGAPTAYAVLSSWPAGP